VNRFRIEEYDQDEKVFSYGDAADKCFYLDKGGVDIISKEGIKFLSLAPGKIFGEIGFLNGALRAASIVSNKKSTMFSLSLKDFEMATAEVFNDSDLADLAVIREAFEPLRPSPEEMAKVARATTIPIAAGERLCTKYEFARLIECGAASIIQMNLGRVGGLLEAKKIAGIAEAHYAQIAPHLYCGPIVGAANIQLATCSPNFLILESIGRWDGFQAELTNNAITWEDGHVIPPTAPGLGIELNEDVANAHPWTGTDLHLVPVFGPVPRGE